MGSELVETPAEVMAKATRMLKRVMSLQVVWFVCFLGGGLVTLRAAWKNTHLPAACNGQGGTARASSVVAAVTAGCAHHSYLVGVILVLVGIAGLLVTGYVATRLAVRYLGAGAMAFLRSGRSFVGPMGPRRGAQDAGGFPGSPGGSLNVGLPPGEGAPPQPPHRNGPSRG
jgi:hypothetical protein